MKEAPQTIQTIGSTGLTGPLQVEILPNGISARLVRPFKVKTKSGGVIEVPEGFETDFASVPRFFWRIVPPWGKYSPAAVVHDYLYSTGEAPRDIIDQIFLDLMGELGVKGWKREAMYWAVRTFGGWAWKKHQERRARHA